MSKPASKVSQQGQQFPLCMNKKQAKLVCLNPSCKQHAFFCTNCQNDQCQVMHHHGDKLLSLSFKQYIKRVIKEKTVDDELQEALNRYAECLQKLKKDVQEFVQKQMNQLEQIKRKAQQLGEQQDRVIQKLRRKQYTDLTGADLDKLWQKIVQIQKRDNKETIQFLSIKQQQIKQISDNFQKVNKMQLQDITQEESKNQSKIQSKMSKASKQSESKKQSNLSNVNSNYKKASQSNSYSNSNIKSVQKKK